MVPDGERCEFCAAFASLRVDAVVRLLPVMDFADDFGCVVPVELFVVRRTAARAASVLSAAITPPNASGARHTAKRNLKPFIPIAVMLANL